MTHTDHIDPYDSYVSSTDRVDPYDSYRSSSFVWLIWINMIHMTHTDQHDPYDSYGSTWVKDIFAHSLKMLGAPTIMLSAPNITPTGLLQLNIRTKFMDGPIKSMKPYKWGIVLLHTTYFFIYLTMREKNKIYSYVLVIRIANSIIRIDNP